MDRMNRRYYLSLLIIPVVLWLMFPIAVIADEGTEPKYSASPSATIKPTIKSTPLARCAVRVTNGVKANSATDVTFIMKGTIGGQNISDYAYDFGDGEVASGGAEITHHYRQAGNYTITATPKIDLSQDKLACKTTVTIKTNTLQSHESQCTSLELVTGDSWTVDQTSKMRIKGSDNKGELQGYRLDVEEQVWEQSGGDFEIQLASAGAYLVKAFVKDSTGAWIGGTDNCVRQVKVTQVGITTQPETGPGTGYWASLLILSILWVGVMAWRRYQHLQIG